MMKNEMECPICKEKGRAIFQGKIMGKYEIQYYQCRNCAFVYTERPYWLEESYLDSITSVDTGIMSRNVDNVLAANVLLKNFFSCDKVFLDYGGGYGIFTRMMRDIGYNWLWQDKFSENYLARGFEYKNRQKIELITAFELFEHFDRPIEEMEYLFKISDSILFSTLLYDDGNKYKKFGDWWYYVPETGQHISFYSKITLEYIAKKYNVNYYKINDALHLFTTKKLNVQKLNALINRKYSWIIQSFYYHKARKNNRAVQDMNMILRKRECDG